MLKMYRKLTKEYPGDSRGMVVKVTEGDAIIAECDGKSDVIDLSPLENHKGKPIMILEDGKFRDCFFIQGYKTVNISIYKGGMLRLSSARIKVKKVS